MTAATAVRADGAALFARFAYPPNALGYCGGDDAATLLGLAGTAAAGGPASAELAALARGFAGAYPYLRLIAACAGRADPLDAGVVAAYWLGNALLRRVAPATFAAHLADRFTDRAGAGMADLATLALLGAVPHHNFHVFAVYPWVGLLRAGHGGAEPLRVLDSCRVRWGRVLSVHDGPTGAVAEVSTNPLTWDGRTLALGPVALRQAYAATAGGSLAPRVRAGDVVALHWDWVCQVLDPPALAALRRYTTRILDMTNTALARPVAAAVLD